MLQRAQQEAAIWRAEREREQALRRKAGEAMHTLMARLQSVRADIVQRDADLAQRSAELSKLHCRITELDQVTKGSFALSLTLGWKL